MMDLSVEYYKDLTRISNSNIGWYLKKGPQYLRDMLDGKAEGIKGASLEKGTMIHMYILQPEDFWKEYMLFNFELPKSAQQKTFCEEYAKCLNPLEPDKEKIDAYKIAYKTDKLSDDKILEAAENLLEIYPDYLEYLKLKEIKKIISYADLNMLKSIESNIKAHKKANELIYNLPETCEAHNEFHINWDFPEIYNDCQIKCKSLLDRVIFDHTNKKIVLIDIKTTIDTYNFSHSIEEYDYNRQLAYYWLAIHWYMLKELNIEISDYSFETFIIAIQNNTDYNVRVFKIQPIDIENRLITISQTISNISWHLKNNLWEHYRDYYTGDGAETIHNGTS